MDTDKTGNATPTPYLLQHYTSRSRCDDDTGEQANVPVVPSQLHLLRQVAPLDAVKVDDIYALATNKNSLNSRH
jgi:hypothetical protein